MFRKLRRQTKRIFSSLALVLLLAQNMLPLGQLFSSPLLAQAVESPVTPVPFESVRVELTAENNFEVSVQSEVDVPLVLAYTHGELQEGIEATAVVADGVAKASQYAGTCSADDCTPHEVTKGTLTLVNTDQVFSFTVTDDELWLTDGKKASVASVEAGKTYKAPQNDQVSVTFSELPETPGSLSIEEVTLSDEQVTALGATSNIAYDITSDMENGTFAYNLKLPLPEGMDGDSKVVFAESVEQLTTESAQVVSESQVAINTDDAVVSVSELNHFTVFVVTSFEEDQTTPPTDSYNDIWFTNAAGTTVTRVPSGTNGITSSDGDNHAEIDGYAFTRWNGYKYVFPAGGYDTTVDVYLDMSLADGSVDKRFDYTSAVSNTTSGHRRDFIFHIGTNPSVANQFLANASNNSPGHPGAAGSVDITTSGWYRLEHQFRDVGGVLEVTMNLYQIGNPTPIGTWVRSDASDIIGSTVGGNRYGWFTGNRFDFDWLAIDRATIKYASLNESVVVVTPGDLHDWVPTTTSDGTVEFITSSGSPSGDGSLQLITHPSDNNSRASLVKSTDTLLSSLDELSYKTRQNNAETLEGNAAYRIAFDADGDSGTTTDRATLIYEPYWQNGGSPDPDPVVPDVWQLWDVDTGLFWASIPGGNTVPGLTNGAGGPPFYSLDDVKTLHPNAKVTAVSVGIGSYNRDYDIEVDDFVFSYLTEEEIVKTTYDFEPNPLPVVTIDDAVVRIVDEQACGIGSAWNDDGLKVNIENWSPGYKLMGRYFTQGGSFGGWFDLSTWAPVVVSGNDASFFVANSGNSVQGEAGWEVKVVDENNLDISNVDSLSYYIATDQSSAACGGVEISVCKEDDNGQPLSGWELILSGREEVADTTFNTLHSTGVTIPGLTAGNFYQVEVSGTWSNGSLETRDAFYGAMGPNVGNLDPINTGVYDPRIVKVVLDDTPSTLIDFPSWWGPYTTTNTYSTIYEATDTEVNVRLWDFPIGSSNTSWYNDNTGLLNVKVYELTDSQVVTTSQNGCGVVPGVIAGDYYLSEVPQTNWQYVSGGGDIVVDEQSTEFTIVNKSLIPEVEPELADVTVCKEDTNETRLPGWQVQLYNSQVLQSQFVDATTGVASALEAVSAGDYILRASGQYTYRSTTGAEFSDAGWSKRDPGDAVYGGAFVPWVNVMTFPNPNTGWLGVMVNGDSNWGSYFNPDHIYSRSLAGYAGGDITLQILDDQYGDNVGGVTVDLHAGYSGVTGQDGCVTFTDVPYGEYQLDETMRMGWENESGIGGVEVDSETESFTLTNASTQTPEPSPSPSPTPTPTPEPTPSPTPTPPSVVLSASKVLCESEADLPDTVLGGAITATTAQEWVEHSDGNCQLVSEWPFQWSPAEGGTFGAFQVDTTSMSEPWQSFVAGEVTIPLSASTSSRFEVREVFPEDENDYIPFTNDSSVSAQLACTGDGAGYDNWEWVNNPQAGSTYYCVAFNALVGEPEASPSPSPSPSASPEPTVEPEIVPTPTPEPTSTPTPAPQVLGSSTESSSSNGNPSAPQCTAQKPNGAPIVQVTASGDNQVTLSWTAVSPVTHYGIFFNEVGGASYGASNIGNVTSYTINSLTPGATYTFEVMGVNDCAPGDRSAVTTSDAIIGGPVETGPTGPAGEVLGEGDELTPEEQQAQDEKAAAEAAALAGQVAGVSDEICENQATPYLPLIFLLCMAVISLLIEFMVKRGLFKFIGHTLVFGIGIALFYWLANCDCEAVTASTILMFLCTWFWVVALAQTLILRGVGYLFIQED